MISSQLQPRLNLDNRKKREQRTHTTVGNEDLGERAAMTSSLSSHGMNGVDGRHGQTAPGGGRLRGGGHGC